MNGSERALSLAKTSMLSLRSAAAGERREREVPLSKIQTVCARAAGSKARDGERGS